MFAKFLIALIAFLVVFSVVSAQEWQPSWAHDPIPLVQGQEYKTGSPLSQPGLGLFGGIANALTGGNLPQLTGGGSIVWTGETETCAGIEINGDCTPILSLAEAQSILDEMPITDNTAYATEERSCNMSKAEQMKLAIKLYEQGITAFDCGGNPIESAATGCDVGEVMTVAYVEDAKLGVKAVYTCTEVK
jgi:hypothetical protein